MLKHLSELEDESVSIIRDTYRQANNPIILFSIGKDSTVLTHLFKKAFFPLKVPVKLLHIDTTWKFKEMIEFRDNYAKENNFELIVHTNKKAISENITPFNNKNYTDIMKTETLLEALKNGSMILFMVELGGMKNPADLKKGYCPKEVKTSHGILEVKM